MVEVDSGYMRRRKWRRRLAKAAAFSMLSAPAYFAYEKAMRYSQKSDSYIAEQLHLTKGQGKEYLGISAHRPYIVKRFEAWPGWNGPGIYIFERASGFKTPYLRNEKQLDNWNYVLFGRDRLDTHDGPRTASHAIVNAVENLRKKGLNRLKRQ